MSAPLLARTTEEAALERLLDGLAEGRGAVMLIQGPAGIGKTALLDGLRERAETRGVRALSARGSELDRGFAHGVVHQLLGPAVAAAAADGRAGVLQGVKAPAAFLLEGTEPAPVQPFAVLHALTWLVSDLADEAPLLLLVDDLHWADGPSLRFLEHLGRRLEGQPIAVVATTRRDEPGAEEALLDEISSGPVADVIWPRPLDEAAVATLLNTALEVTCDEAFASAALRVTGGNPLLASVLAREARAGGLTGQSADRAQLEALGARGVAQSVRRRLRALGPVATAIAQAAAIAGPRGGTAELAVLADVEQAVALGAHDDLVRTEVLAPDGVDFVHPLVKAAVVADCPASTRAGLHRRAAVLLRAAGASAQEVAVHRRAVPPAGDVDALDDLRAAARAAAAQGAAGEAAELMVRALAEPPPDPERGDTELELAELEMRAGRPEGVGRLRRLLDDGLEGDAAARASAALAGHLVLSDPVGGVDLLEQAARRAQGGPLALGLEAHALEALFFADAFSQRLAQRLDAGATDPDASVAMSAVLAADRARRGGRVEDVAPIVARALAGGELLHAVGPASATFNFCTSAWRYLERADESAAAIRDGERLAQARGSLEATPYVEYAWAHWHRDFGSVAVGAARATVGTRVLEELGRTLTVPTTRGVLAECLLHADRLDEALEAIEIPLEPTLGTLVAPHAYGARGLVRLAAGRFADAESDLRKVVEACDTRGWAAPLALRGRLRLTTLLARTERREEALQHSDLELSLSRSLALPGALGAVLRVRAEALGGDEAIEALEESVALLEPTPLRLELGWALHDLGARLRIRGDRLAAREPLRRALDLAARTESARLARHARAELDAAGARPRRERLGGVEGLTPAERRVADLAVEGSTNRQIAQTLWVTQKTVEMHLGRVYAKLGIRSRSGLAQALEAEQQAQLA